VFDMTKDQQSVETERELKQLAYSVALLDLIALGIGCLFARVMGPITIWLGAGVAVFVTLVFVLIWICNVAVVWLIKRLSTR
jgi:membrane protein YdbS with pleckstrin-like domain